MSNQTIHPHATILSAAIETCQRHPSFRLQPSRRILHDHPTAPVPCQPATQATRRQLTGAELAARILKPLARQD